MRQVMSRMTGIHLLSNGLLLLLGYYWLGIAESHTSTLVWSICVALFIVVLGVWTYGASFVYFRQRAEWLKAWRTSLRHVLPLALATLAVLLLYWALAKWADYSSQPAFRIASYITLKLRKPVRPSSIQLASNTILWLVQWMVLPVLFLPMLSAISASGWRGFTAVGSNMKRWLYWVETPVLLFCAVRLPLLLVRWVPHADSFGVQTASFAARAVVAYLLFGGAWLLLASVTPGGIPRPTQPSTAVSP
jgi:hypothetical protein